MASSGDDRVIFDALEEAQSLYERYLELSRVADLVYDKQEELVPPVISPMELRIVEAPAGFVLNRS